MKEELLEVIENQIRDQDPKSTKEFYELLISHDIAEEEAKDVLIALLDIHIRNMLKQETEFDDDLWDANLERFSKGILENIKGTSLTTYQMEKNMDRIRKEFGFIPINTECVYDPELTAIESTLYAFYQTYEINSLEAKQIVMMIANHLYSYITGTAYDLFTGCDKKIYLISAILEEKCNPYWNEQLKELLSKQVKLNHEDDRIIFTPMLLCFECIYKSIKFWEKQRGSDGYFSFLCTMEDDLYKADCTMAFNEFTINKQK